MKRKKERLRSVVVSPLSLSPFRRSPERKGKKRGDGKADPFAKDSYKYTVESSSLIAERKKKRGLFSYARGEYIEKKKKKGFEDFVDLSLFFPPRLPLR